MVGSQQPKTSNYHADVVAPAWGWPAPAVGLVAAFITAPGGRLVAAQVHCRT